MHGDLPATRGPWRRANWIAVIATLSVALQAASAGAQYYRAPVRDRDHFVQKYTWSYIDLRNRQVVMQKHDYSCGAAALATVIRYYWGDPVTEDQFLLQLEKLLTPAEVKERVQNGLALTDLRNLANKAGYDASLGKVEFKQLTEAEIPVVVGIVYKGFNHFVVFRGAEDGWVYLADPIRGNVRVGEEEFQHQWQKNAILVVAKPNTDVKKVNPMRVRDNEVYRGWLNAPFVRQDGLTYKPVVPFVPQ